MNKITLAAGVFAVLAAAFSLAAPVQAGTCQTVKAKGVAKDLKTARYMRRPISSRRLRA